MVIILNTSTMAKVFQPQIDNLFFEVLGTPKTWLILTLVPLAALLPDLLVGATRQVFKKNPVDIVLNKQKHARILPIATPANRSKHDLDSLK